MHTCAFRDDPGGASPQGRPANRTRATLPGFWRALGMARPFLAKRRTIRRTRSRPPRKWMANKTAAIARAYRHKCEDPSADAQSSRLGDGIVTPVLAPMCHPTAR